MSAPWASGITEEGPGNWNGITGRIELQVTDSVWIEAVRVFADVPGKPARVQVKVRNLTGKGQRADLLLSASPRGTTAPPAETKTPVEISAKPETNLELSLSLGSTPRLWDQFSPALYDLSVSLGGSQARTVFGVGSGPGRARSSPSTGARSCCAATSITARSRYRAIHPWTRLPGSGDCGSTRLRLQPCSLPLLVSARIGLRSRRRAGPPLPGGEPDVDRRRPDFSRHRAHCLHPVGGGANRRYVRQPPLVRA